MTATDRELRSARDSIVSDPDFRAQVIENEQIYHMLRSTIAKELGEKFEEKRMRSINFFVGIISVVLTITGLISGFLVNEALNSRIENSVDNLKEDFISDFIEKAEAAIFETRVSSLNVRAQNMDESEEFRRLDAEFVADKIRELYREGVEETEGATKKRENARLLHFAATAAARTFAAAPSASTFSVALAKDAPMVFSELDEAHPFLVIGIGNYLLQDAQSPDSWNSPSGSLWESYQSLQRFLASSETSGFPEMSLLYKLLIGTARGDSPSELESIAADFDVLSDDDKNNMVGYLGTMAANDVNPQQRRLANLANSIFEFAKISSNSNFQAMVVK